MFIKRGCAFLFGIAEVYLGRKYVMLFYKYRKNVNPDYV